MTSPPPAGPSPSQPGTASSASPGADPQAVGLEAREPIWPQPQAFTANLLKRLSRGLGSWFGLLNEWDFRIGIGSTNVLGLEMVLVNRPDLVRQVLVEEPEAFPKHPYTQWILEPLIGQGLFAVNGAEWQRQRRLVDQALQVLDKKGHPGYLHIGGGHGARTDPPILPDGICPGRGYLFSLSLAHRAP